jgi:hypothetical protein
LTLTANLKNESKETGQAESFKWQEKLPRFPNTLHSLGIFSSLHDCKETVLERLQQCLPTSTVASSLVGIYFDHGAWLFAFFCQVVVSSSSADSLWSSRYNAISMSRFFEEVYNPVYASESGQTTLSAISPHNTALLFIVFALGSFLSKHDTDTTEHYHQLARTAMSCDAILVDPTMPAIRTLVSILLPL